MESSENTSDVQLSTPTLQLLTEGDVTRLRTKYANPDNLIIAKPNKELKQLIKRFREVNLKQEEEILANRRAGNELMTKGIPALREWLARTSSLMHIQPELITTTLAQISQSDEERRLSKKRLIEMRRKGKMDKKAAIKASREYDRRLKNYTRSFENSFRKSKLFGISIQLKLALIKISLTLAALAFTIGFDWLVWEIDENIRHYYLYHAGFFLLFAVIDRFGVRYLEEHFTKSAKEKMFHSGLNFLQKECVDFFERLRQRLKESGIDPLLP